MNYSSFLYGYITHVFQELQFPRATLLLFCSRASCLYTCLVLSVILRIKNEVVVEQLMQLTFQNDTECMSNHFKSFKLRFLRLRISNTESLIENNINLLFLAIFVLFSCCLNSRRSSHHKTILLTN